MNVMSKFDFIDAVQHDLAHTCLNEKKTDLDLQIYLILYKGSCSTGQLASLLGVEHELIMQRMKEMEYLQIVRLEQTRETNNRVSLVSPTIRSFIQSIYDE